MRQRIKRLWGNEFIQGGFFVTFSTIFVSFISYLFHFLAGRSLGPAGYGEITALYSYYNLIVVPIVVIMTVITQKISAHTKNQISYVMGLEDFFWEKLRKWWILGLLMIILIPLIPQLTNLSLASSITFVFLVILAFLCSFYSSAFQGLRLFLLFSIINISTILIRLAGPVLTTAGIDGVPTVLLFLIISGIIQLFISKLFLNRHVSHQQNHPRFSINKRLMHIFLNKQIIIAGISLFAITALNNIDIIYVKKFLPAEATGLYSVWSLFSRLIFFVISPMISVGFVFFADVSEEKKQHKIFILLLLVLLIIGLVSYLSYSLLAGPIINILFGYRFGKIIPFLSLASIFGILYTAVFFINNYFLAKKSSFALILACFIPLYIVGLILIPKRIDSLMQLDIVFSFVLGIAYFTAYLIRNKKII